MKTLIKTVSAVTLFSIGSLTMAETCPDNLNADDTYDCIVAEGGIKDINLMDESNHDQPAKATFDSKANQASVDDKRQPRAGL